MFVADTQLLSTARQYKTELLTKIFGTRVFEIAAQAVSRETATTISDLPSSSNIVGIGYGLKITSNSAIQSDLAVRVYVREKLPKSLLSFAEKIPSNINGLATDVIPVGDIVALARPTKCGVSVGHYKVAAGTLGCLVKLSDVETNKRYILSNNHVLANCNQTKIGDPILEPGSEDGGELSNPIAILRDYQKLHFVNLRILERLRIFGSRINTMDAAIAEVLNTNEIYPEITEIGKLQKPEMLPSLGQTVCKYGRSTQYKSGVIGDISFDVKGVKYPRNKCADFVEQIVIDWTEQEFSRKGDSGSLIVAQSTKQPVALLFAGGNGRSFATPIARILQRFQVEIL